MTEHAELHFRRIDETGVRHLAEQLAPRLRRGDFLALHGDLGAGKTAFARHLIRALTGRSDQDVPSPTYTLVQPYETQRFTVHHFDFYRLGDPGEALELGLADASESGVVIAEWPERLGGGLPGERLDITLEDCGSPDLRDLKLSGANGWSNRLRRLHRVSAFLKEAGWQEAVPVHINGDASTRSYTRLHKNGASALLMDAPKMPDGPPIRDGKPYSRIAHLAEDVRPFIAVAEALREAGLRAPEILARDEDSGLLLIEDFGDLTFTRLAGQQADLAPHYRLAVDALLRLRHHPPAERIECGAITHSLPDYDQGALGIETELLLDWLLPALTGRETPDESRQEFFTLWTEQFAWLLKEPGGWVLRDYHSPNLIAIPDAGGLEALGLIDFQDAMRGHAAYDLVSLLQDARLDFPGGLERGLLAHYCDRATGDFERADFLRAYRLLGAQRATKILGIFARLARRDGKRGYLKHLPRITAYLWSNLHDPHLAELKSWYERMLPGDLSVLTETAKPRSIA